MIFTFGKPKIDVDIAKTREFYERPTTPCGFCGCADCRNFEEYAKTAPAELREWFRALGLNICNPGEVYSLFEEKDGLLMYGGWWHLCGEIIETNRLGKQSENDGYDVTENFKVSFHDKCNCVPHDFPKPVIQMEIEAFIPILSQGSR